MYLSEWEPCSDIVRGHLSFDSLPYLEEGGHHCLLHTVAVQVVYFALAAVSSLLGSQDQAPLGQEDLFSSCSCDDSQTVAVLRGRLDSLAKEQALTTETYEAYILKLHEHFRIHGVPLPDV